MLWNNLGINLSFYLLPVGSADQRWTMFTLCNPLSSQQNVEQPLVALKCAQIDPLSDFMIDPGLDLLYYLKIHPCCYHETSVIYLHRVNCLHFSLTASQFLSVFIHHISNSPFL